MVLLAANRYVLLKCFKAVIKEFSGEAQQFLFVLKVGNGHSANVANVTPTLSICEGVEIWVLQNPRSLRRTYARSKPKQFWGAPTPRLDF